MLMTRSLAIALAVRPCCLINNAAVRQMSFSSTSGTLSMYRLADRDLGEHELSPVQQRPGVVHSLGTGVGEGHGHSFGRLNGNTVVALLQRALDVPEDRSLVVLVALLSQRFGDKGL